VSGATDADGNPLTYAITDVRQDEPAGSQPDAQLVSRNAVNIRAQRDGRGNGRVYEIAVTVTDEADGGTCTGTVTVAVPHDQSGGAAVNDGALYPSL
jgi:hypothetical protein